MSDTAPALLGVAAVAPARPAPMPARWRDYATLTKPRIMSLLVLTSVCAMIVAAHGDPSPVRLIGLVIGGALACGGASALNHVLDRDIDRLMGPRTATRPVAAGRISPGHAVAFGLSLLALAFLVLTALDNLLAATLSLSGAAFYALVYTVWLKRRTAQNIMIGGVYSVALTLLTLAPGLLGTFDAVYLVTALLLGLTMCALAVRLWRRPAPATASALFHFSVLYLALLFVSAAVGAGVQ